MISSSPRVPQASDNNFNPFLPLFLRFIKPFNLLLSTVLRASVLTNYYRVIQPIYVKGGLDTPGPDPGARLVCRRLVVWWPDLYPHRRGHAGEVQRRLGRINTVHPRQHGHLSLVWATSADPGPVTALASILWARHGSNAT